MTRHGDRRGGRHGGSLATRLFAAQALIVAAGATTLVIVAVVIAPGLFRSHLQRAVGPVPPDLAHHLDRALAEALLISLAIAVAAALATTLAVSWFITRRLTRPVAAMATAATRIADGDYDTRVPASRLGVEFTLLDNAFNRMAATLRGTERRRRELLADLAHELRTPVATLDSFLEGIEDEVIPTTGQTWQTMRQQTARLRRLVDDVDSVSRAEERQLQVDPQPVNVDAVVAEAVRATTAAFRDKRVVLDHQASPVPAQVRADPDRLREILDNLLSNALRHTPGRRHGHRDHHRRPCPRRRRRRRHRRRDRSRAPAAPVRALLPRRPGAQPHHRRLRHRPDHRPRPRPRPRW